MRYVVGLVLVALLPACPRAASVEHEAKEPKDNLTQGADQEISQLKAQADGLRVQIREKIEDLGRDPAMASVAKELEAHLNSSDLNSNSTDDLAYGNHPLSGRRRESSNGNDGVVGKTKKLEKIFLVDNLYSKKDRNGKKWKNRMANKAAIQEKLDTWLQARLTEKAKIKAYKEKQRQKTSFREKCPSHGVKKSRKWRRMMEIRGKRYPCCRKCCKKSYLGCL